MARGLLKKFLSASFLIISISVVSRLFGLLREMVIAKEFGLSKELDVVYLSLMVPTFLVTVVSNPLSSSFIPRYNQLLNDGKEDATRFLQKVFSLVIVGASLLALIYVLCSGFLFNHLLSIDTANSDVQFYSVLLALWVILQSLSNFIMGLLENEQYFSLTSASSAIISIVVVLVIIFMPWEGSIVLGSVLGTIIFLGFQLFILVNKTELSVGFKSVLHQQDHIFITEYKWLVLGSALMGSTFLVDQTMASSLGDESVSALNYGFRVITLFTGTISLALGAVALPFFSKLKVEGEFKQMKQLLNRLLVLVFLFCAFIGFGIWVFGKDLVSLIFEYGAFEQNDTRVVSEVFLFYSIQLPFYIGGFVLVKVIAAMQKSKRIMLVSLLNLVLNIAFNFILIQYLGLAGIALSTSLVYFVSFVGLYIQANQFVNAEIAKKE